MNFNKPFLLFLLHVIVLSCLNHLCRASEAEALIKFKESLSNPDALNDWKLSVNPCDGDKGKWTGLLCDDGMLFGLRLEGMNLSGTIKLSLLGSLPRLWTISFMNNRFNGPMPDVKKLQKLRGLFLSNNNFSGEISDDAFSGMNSIRRVYLANNEFKGKIPASLAELPKLVEVQLQDNQFEGEIPDFEQKDLQVNMANNRLEGPIPAGLSDEKFANSFSGNLDLCGKPLTKPCKPSKKKFSKLIIILIAAGVAALAAILIWLFFFKRLQKNKQARLGKPLPEKVDKKNLVVNNNGKGGNNGRQRPDEEQENLKKSEQGSLCFVNNKEGDDQKERFDLHDLLRASAEVLGSGSFGSSYKAILSEGPTMVVKRFRHMSNVGKDEFYEHMRRLGGLSHPNLLPLVAFYYRKEEKLLITDFVKNGSLASHLHGKRGPNNPGLDWPTRLKIIKGVAKGLFYLHKALPSTMTLPHGHLKSTNVLLTAKYDPLLTDYALVPVINKDHAQQQMVAYKSPDFTQQQPDRTTRKTDVWSLGILVLEMLTGKFPANYMKQGKGDNNNGNNNNNNNNNNNAAGDLGTWVNSVIREEWTGEVFDKDMKGVKNGEGEMLKLLKIGICCCEWNSEKRWDLDEAVDKIEELKERDSDEDVYSSYASEGDVYSSSRAMTDDDFSFSVTA